MVLSGQHTINYTLNGENKRICIKVKIKPTKGLIDPGEPLWETKATINGMDIDQSEVKGTVNAQIMAEDIANDRLQKLREKHGRSLRVKNK